MAIDTNTYPIRFGNGYLAPVEEHQTDAFYTKMNTMVELIYRKRMKNNENNRVLADFTVPLLNQFKYSSLLYRLRIVNNYKDTVQEL